MMVFNDTDIRSALVQLFIEQRKGWVLRVVLWMTFTKGLKWITYPYWWRAVRVGRRIALDNPLIRGMV